ncbi:TPA: excinuclease ABC subunit A [Pasteurella multocida]|nr:excinuclease ABC subunit A [Pasteurella multocida]
MKKLLLISAMVALTACSARNDAMFLPISDVVNSSEAKAKLDPSIKMAFGSKLSGKVVAAELKTSKSANAFNRDDISACRRAMLSALIQLQHKAKELGVHKISNIQSNYKNNPYSSTTQYECHVGHFPANVALKADFVK